MQVGPKGGVRRRNDCEIVDWYRSRRYMSTMRCSVPKPVNLRSMPIKSQRLNPHGSLQCHEPRGSSTMQVYAVCRTAGGIGSAYATGHEDMTCCMENSSGCAPDASPSGNTDTQVLPKFLLTRCELEAARDCVCRNGSHAQCSCNVWDVCGTLR